jgi:hypothetical protein
METPSYGDTRFEHHPKIPQEEKYLAIWGSTRQTFLHKVRGQHQIASKFLPFRSIPLRE